MWSVLQAGCDVHTRDTALDPLLHLAAGCGSLDVVAKLVDAAARIHLPILLAIRDSVSR